MKHRPDAQLLRCVRCREDWPCFIAFATNTTVAFVRGEITKHEMGNRMQLRFAAPRSLSKNDSP